jgi:hypothetical protein
MSSSLPNSTGGNMNRSALVAVFISLLFWIGAIAQTDIQAKVILKDGTTYTGKFIGIANEIVYIEDSSGNTLKLNLSTVDVIFDTKTYESLKWRGSSTIRTNQYQEPSVSPSTQSQNQLMTNYQKKRVFLFLGTGLGLSTSKNSSVADLWNQTKPDVLDEYDNLNILSPINIDLIVKPFSRISIGMAAKYFWLSLGQSGATETDHPTYWNYYGGYFSYHEGYTVKTAYDLRMSSLLLGGFVRCNFTNYQDGDAYLQLGYGKNKLYGSYSVNPDYKISQDFWMDLTGSAPYYDIGLGLSGGWNKVLIVSLSIDYIISSIDEIKYKIVTNESDKTQEGRTGIVFKGADNSKIKACYDGIFINVGFGVGL